MKTLHTLTMKRRWLFLFFFFDSWLLEVRLVARAGGRELKKLTPNVEGLTILETQWFLIPGHHNSLFGSFHIASLFLPGIWTSP